jgi:protein MBA1
MSTRTPMQRLLQQHNGYTPLLVQSFSQQQPCLRQSTRLFSNTSYNAAGVRNNKSYAPQQPNIKQPAQKSFEVMKKEQMKNIEQMPNDVGLIPG